MARLARITPAGVPAHLIQRGNVVALLAGERRRVVKFNFTLTPIIARQYGWQPDGTWGTAPLYLNVGGKTYYYQNDHLGTPQKLITASGAVVWSAEFEAFGLAHVGVDAVGNPLRFPGQYFDIETGTHYNYFRDYDPSIGRYVESDPIGLDGGVNSYGYVNNSTTKFFDNYGLYQECSYWGGVCREYSDTMGNVMDGAGSYIRGNYRNVRYALRRSGAFGDCEKTKAEIEGMILAEVMLNEKFRNQLIDEGKKYFDNNKARVTGRLLMGGIVARASPRAAYAMTPAAINGDLRYVVEQGVTDVDAMADAIVGGYVVSVELNMDCSCQE